MKPICAAPILLSLALLTSACAASRGTGPSFKGPVGVQLYSLRAQLGESTSSGLDLAKQAGTQYVELAGTYNLPPDQFKTMLDQRGLIPISGHFPFERYRDDVAGIAREAKALGLQYVGCAWIPHEGEFDEAECRNAIQVFNKAGEALRAEGLRFFYHNHGYEFAKLGQGTLMDLLMNETRPEWVAFQMDVFWVVHPAQDPAQWLKKYPRRWELMHLKDMRKGAPTGFTTGRADVADNVVLGTGQMNWPEILKTAQATGVKYYFIEDESPSSAQQIPKSLAYLESVSW